VIRQSGMVNLPNALKINVVMIGVVFNIGQRRYRQVDELFLVAVVNPNIAGDNFLPCPACLLQRGAECDHQVFLQQSHQMF